MKIERSLIIRIRDDSISDIDALRYVGEVVNQGRVSGYGQSYGYITRFQDDTMVAAVNREKSHVFNVWREKND